LGYNYGFGGNNQKWLTRGIYAASSTQTHDSLQDWIATMPKWDGVERLKTWMIECCGAPDKELNEWISYVTIMQMIARAKAPGCMARLVTIFEGPENKGKTRAIRILGHPWAITFDMSMDSKEAHMIIQGAWLAELAELDTLRKTTETRLKSFVSQTTDTYVPKYSNYRVGHPRRTVFIGTTNDENYLPGQTGNTRWLPIKTEWFDLVKLEAIREQLFAEAIAIFRSTPDIEWWEEPEHIREQLAAERDKRRIINIYEDSLENWLNGEHERNTVPYKNIRFEEIAKDFLQIETPQGWKDVSLQRQIRDALVALDWRRGFVWRNKKSFRGWIKPGENSDDDSENDDVPF